MIYKNNLDKKTNNGIGNCKNSELKIFFFFFLIFDEKRIDGEKCCFVVMEIREGN